MSFLSTGVAVVTGAGSGIGRALAQQLATAGSALALADIDEKGLAETAQSLEKKSALATTHVLDVADEEGVRSFAEDVCKRHERVTLLINNAGVAMEGTFEEISLDDFRWLRACKDDSARFLCAPGRYSYGDCPARARWSWRENKRPRGESGSV